MNPDNSLIVIIENKEETARELNLKIDKRLLKALVQPKSFNTFKIVL